MCFVKCQFCAHVHNRGVLHYLAYLYGGALCFGNLHRTVDLQLRVPCAAIHHNHPPIESTLHVYELHKIPTSRLKSENWSQKKTTKQNQTQTCRVHRTYSKIAQNIVQLYSVQLFANNRLDARTRKVNIKHFLVV